MKNSKKMKYKTKDDPIKGKKHKAKFPVLKVKKQRINISQYKNKKQKAKIKLKASSSLGVVTKRQGGGTLIDSRPIFSLDTKFIYVNCGWGLRAFSVKTGESIRTYDALVQKGSVVGVLLHGNFPTAFTSNGYFISWEGKSGKVVHKYRVSLPNQFNATNAYLVPSLTNAPESDLCVAIRHNSRKKISLQFFDPADGKKLVHPLNDTVVSNSSMNHILSFGGPENKTILASIYSEGLNVYSLNGKECTKDLKASGGRSWTCVRCHPVEEVVAAGDNTGRVVVFTKPLNGPGNRIPRAVYHWHTLACKEIAFSPVGSTMYTGGGENVLVKWSLDNPHVRYFLPRLSADIVHINVSSDNQLVAVATLDNAIQVVEPPIRLKCVLQQLAWGVLPTSLSFLFPAGLVYEPRMRALALNGRPGHLQFYSPLSETILFNLDVTLQNYITQERNKTIINTEVTHVAITQDGAWLATIETRDDPGVTKELRLKLWQYLNHKKSFSLNTSIELPHDGKASSLIFQPCPNILSTNDKINLDYLLATTGTDRKFRFWAPRDLDSIYREGVTWNCVNTCYFRSLECGPASFSEDGSLIAVGFGPSLTIWDVDSIQLKESLTNGSENIKLIAFGMRECCHLLVNTTEEILFVWNLLTLRLSWKVPIKTSILITDPCSTYMAAFTSNNKLFVFTPLSSEIIYESQRVCNRNGRVLSAIFMPREIPFLEGPHWLQNSLLYYIDTNQELICFESEEENGEISMLKLAHDSDPGTLFSALIAAQRASDVKKSKPAKVQNFGILGAAAVTQLLEAPAHTMPPVSLLCSSLLQSLVMKKKTYEKDERKGGKKESVDREEELEEDESSSSDSASDIEEQEDDSKKKNEQNQLTSSKESLIEDSGQPTAPTNETTSDVPYYISELLDSVDNDDGLFVIDD